MTARWEHSMLISSCQLKTLRLSALVILRGGLYRSSQAPLTEAIFGVSGKVEIEI